MVESSKKYNCSTINFPPLEVGLSTNVSRNNLNFIIDTGSSFSFVKLSKIRHRYREIDGRDTRILSGIGVDTVTTVGTMEMIIFVDDVPMKILMHVLDDLYTKLTCDGILGRDFQNFTKMLIDWEHYTIVLTLGDRRFDLSLDAFRDKIVVEGCSQSVHLVRTDFEGISVVSRQEISESF